MKTDRVFAFRQSVGKLVEMLTDKAVTVTQRGTDAYVRADPRTGKPNLVNIPHVPDNASDELLEAINGFLDHEVAHILFTDFGVVDKGVRKSASIAAMHNILEDCRIEKCMAEKFKGSAYNLGTMGAFFVKRMTMPMLDKAVALGDKGQIMSVLIPPLMRSIYGQRVFKEFMTPAMLDLVKPFHDKIRHLEGEILAMSSTEDALVLAEKIDKLARVSGGTSSRDIREGTSSESKKGSKDGKPPSKKAGKGPEEKHKKKESEHIEEERAEELAGEADRELEARRERDATSPEDERAEALEGEESDELTEEVEAASEGDSDFSETPSGDPDDGHDGEPDFDEGGPGRRAAEESGMDSSGSSDDFAETDPADEMSAEDYAAAMSGVEDFDGAVAKHIGAEAAKFAESAKYHVWTTDFDLIEPLPRSHRYSDRLLTTLEDEVNHLVAPMQKDLERIMEARSRAQWSNGHRSGRLHGASLSRILTGDDRVFRRRHETRTKDTAVSLVVDASGSMSGDRIKVACQAAFALSQVLERIGIKHEVIAFTTTSRGSEKLSKEAHDFSKYSRFEPLWMPILKGYEERLNSDTKSRFADLPFHSLANNVDGECVEIAARRLLLRKETGKTMIVLSDGEPCCHGPSPDQYANLTRVVKEVEASGVRCVGIGIQSEAVRRFYSRHIVLRKVEDLPGTVMRELKAALTA